MKIYLVTDGSYSDYHLCCVCSTPEKAEEAKVLYQADNDVEVYELDGLPDHPAGMLPFCVQMDAEGFASDVSRESVDYCVEQKPDWEPYGDDASVAFHMWATDEKHAVKIANERRIVLLATHQWTTDFKAWQKKNNIRSAW